MLIEILAEHAGQFSEEFRAHVESSCEQDIAVDSLHMVSIILHLEEAFGVSLPDEEVIAVRDCLRSVDRMTDYLLDKTRSSRVSIPAAT